MKRFIRLKSDERGASAIEFAIMFPAFMMLVWGIFQFGLVFRAMSGMQHALGEGARYATLYPKPAASTVKSFIEGKVFGTKPGLFEVAEPVIGAGYMDLQVTYTQSTNLLFLPGPDISVSRTKRVWVAT